MKVTSSFKFTDALTLLTSIVIAQAAGLIGSIFTFDAIPNWYATLNRPEFSPPNWLFGPVWVTLYTLMGIAAFLVWQRCKQPGAQIALWMYAVQLLLNTLWSILFFGLRNPGLAFMEIVVLFALIITTTILFFRQRKAAGVLFFPYIFWVGFASVLNAYIWILNT